MWPVRHRPPTLAEVALTDLLLPLQVVHEAEQTGAEHGRAGQRPARHGLPEAARVARATAGAAPALLQTALQWDSTTATVSSEQITAAGKAAEQWSNQP